MITPHDFATSCLTAINAAIELCDFHTATAITHSFYPVEKLSSDVATIETVAEALFLGERYNNCLKFLEPHGNLILRTEHLACLVVQCWLKLVVAVYVGKLQTSIGFMFQQIHLKRWDQAAAFLDTVFLSLEGSGDRALSGSKNITTRNTEEGVVASISCFESETKQLGVLADDHSTYFDRKSSSYPRLAYFDFLVTRTRIYQLSTGGFANASPPSWATHSQIEKLQYTACARLKNATQTVYGSYVLVLLEQAFLTFGDLESWTDSGSCGFSALFTRCPPNPIVSEPGDWAPKWLCDNMIKSTSDSVSYNVPSNVSPLIVAAFVRRHSVRVSQESLYVVERYSLIRPLNPSLIYTALPLLLQYESNVMQGDASFVVRAAADMPTDFKNARLAACEKCGVHIALSTYAPTLTLPLYPLQTAFGAVCRATMFVAVCGDEHGTIYMWFQNRNHMLLSGDVGDYGSSIGFCSTVTHLENDGVPSDKSNTLEHHFHEAMMYWCLGVSALLRSWERRSFALTAQGYLGRALALCFNLKNAWIHLSQAYHLVHQLDQAIKALNATGRLLGRTDDSDYQAQWTRLMGSNKENEQELQ